jgi:hypothetical protein
LFLKAELFIRIVPQIHDKFTIKVRTFRSQNLEMDNHHRKLLADPSIREEKEYFITSALTGSLHLLCNLMLYLHNIFANKT